MIRPSKHSDFNELIEVFTKNVPENFAESEIEDFKDYLVKNEKSYFCIEKNDSIVGGFGYIIDNQLETSSIKWIFMDPNYAGTGLGAMAVEYCIQLFEGLSHIKIVKVETSQLANHFFAKFGFKPTQHIKNYWGKNLDLVRMELHLT